MFSGGTPVPAGPVDGMAGGGGGDEDGPVGFDDADKVEKEGEEEEEDDDDDGKDDDEADDADEEATVGARKCAELEMEAEEAVGLRRRCVDRDDAPGW